MYYVGMYFLETYQNGIFLWYYYIFVTPQGVSLSN